jgi:hypothetical protein
MFAQELLIYKTMRPKVRNIAAQIAAMKPSIPAESTLYNFAFGSLYAFERAIDLGYLNQWRKKEGEGNRSQMEKISMRRARQVKQQANHLMAGRSVTPGEWLAGYYYNDALIRTDVCFEQLARFYGRVRRKSERKERKELERLAIDRGLPNDLIVPWWKNVRDEVNLIKHQSVFTTEGPSIDPETTLRAIEQLIAGVKFVFHKQRD